MKKLLLIAATFFILANSFGQVQTPLQIIDWETPAPVTNGGANNWFLNTTFPNGSGSYTSPTHAYRDTVPAGIAGTTAYFTINTLNCSGSGYVAFQFNHICKIPAAQRGSIEVSVSGAAGPWITL